MGLVSYLEFQVYDFWLLGKEQTTALAFLASTIFSLLNATLSSYSQLLSNFLCSWVPARNAFQWLKKVFWIEGENVHVHCWKNSFFWFTLAEESKDEEEILTILSQSVTSRKHLCFFTLFVFCLTVWKQARTFPLVFGLRSEISELGFVLRNKYVL